MANPAYSGGMTELEWFDSSGAIAAPSGGSNMGDCGDYGSGGWGDGIRADYPSSYSGGEFANTLETASLEGGQVDLGGSQDLSGDKKLITGHAGISDNEDGVGVSSGYQFGFVTDNDDTKERIYNVHGSDMIPRKIQFFLIDLTSVANANVADAGFDESDVTDLLVGVYSNSQWGGCSIDDVSIMVPYVMTAGDATTPHTWARFCIYIEDDQDEAEYCYIVLQRSSNKMIDARCAFAIGNGSTATRFEDEIFAVEFCRNYSAVSGDLFPYAHLVDNSLGMDFNLSASCYVRMSLALFMSSNPFYWDEAGSTSADVVFQNVTVQNAGRVTILDTWERNGMIFDDCARVNGGNPTMNGCIVQNGAGIKMTNGSNSDGLTLGGNSIALTVLATGGNVTFDASGLIFADDNTVDVRWEGASGETLTINAGPLTDIDSGKLSTPNGGSIVINNAVDLTITCKDEAGTVIENVRCAIYKTSDDSELMNELTTALGVATEQINYTAETAIYWRARKSSTGTRFFPAKGTGTITGSGFSTEVTMIEDPIVA